MRMVDEHQSGLRDFSAPLWSVLMFEAFCRQRDRVGSGDGILAPETVMAK
jgi:asparagine synthase (glutamine-hydrolysing)